MCGIFGFIGNEDASKFLLEGIKRLEYRGYDSVGMATIFENGIHIKKDKGNIDEVHKKHNFLSLKGNTGITHTRWSTHGKVSKENAHPHSSCDGSIVLVHNGIIENYQELKEKLKNHAFKSETDTEVIVHYFEEKLKNNKKNIKEAIVDFFNDIEGTFAILLLKKDEPDTIYAIKRDSPLVLGVLDGKKIIASDIYAFSNLTNRAIFFDNNEFAAVSKDSYHFYNKEGKEIEKEIKKFEWSQEKSEKKEYSHYMIKEIMEEPLVLERLFFSLENEQKENFDVLVDLIKKSRKILFVAAGTSYHASLLGAYFLHQCNIEAQTLIASEFRNFATVDSKTLVIAITQSGETMDVIEALKYCQEKNAKIVSLVNVPYSTIQRMSEFSINILAGQEVCVAATKSFINQVSLLLKLAEKLGYNVNLNKLKQEIKDVLAQKNKIKKIADEIYMKNDLYILGRGLSYPVAREIALKVKEISYIHAEGMMGGELKHGTLALIENGTPVICLISNNDCDMISNTKEVESRGANVIIVSNEYPGSFRINTENDGKFGILAVIFGQLLTYYMALRRNLPIDKPRNLAKSVTVK